jgi:Pro-kumamolisin, activation domain/Bacterial Ig-like domain (group 3)
MKIFQRKDLYAACVTLLSASVYLGGIARAQNLAPQARIVEVVQNEKLVTLRGNVHPMARPANDRGSLPDQQPVTRMHVLLERSAEQEAALAQLLADQQDPNSSKFHAWLTPQEFGQQFGPAESDLQAVKAWLNSQGFTSLRVNNGRTLIEFSGTSSQIRNAFHTEMHRLSINNEEHFANMQEPKIPAALAPVVGGIAGLHNFRPKPLLHRLGKFRRDASTGQITPLFTFTDVNGTFYGVGPADFAKIYNVPSTFDGTGQSIAIVGQSNINLQDVRDFRTIFGLPTNDPQIILNGADPGLVSGDEGESDLDVEWAGAIAPKAKIILVASQFTDTDGGGGVHASAEYIVDNNVAPVLSESYGACESGLGTAGNAFYNALWQQAAAQGITVVVSTGDDGSAGCDDPNSQSSATQGIAVSGIASTPYSVAMGGTDFDQANLQTTFWNSTNGNPTQVSAKGYIPETTWNDSCANAATAANLTVCANATATSTTAPLNIVAGSGGPSSIYTKTQAPWQTGFGDTTARDLPDVSLFSSDGQNGSFYIVCQSDQNITGDTGCNLTTFSTTSPFHDFQGVGGTSAAAPTFAGIVALVNQKTGQRQGNANITLYSLAKSESFASCASKDGSGSATNTTCVFNDITKGNISVPCAGASPNCSKTSSGGFGVVVSNGNPAFGAGTGYDLATGLGSVNVANLISKWITGTAAGNSTSTTLSPASVTGAAGSVSGNLTGTVTGSGGTPTGVVILENAITSAPLTSGVLSAGSYSLAAALLPQGTYTVKAHYSGDGTFAPSESSAITVVLSKQSSAVTVSFVTFTNSGAVAAISAAAQNVQYGSDYTLRVDVAGTSSGLCTDSSGNRVRTCPTGTVNLFDGTSALNDFPNAQNPNASSTSRLNDRGFTEDQPIQLNVGAHAIKATYTADATSSYNSQTSSNSLSVTITQATTTTAVTSSASSITSGGGVTLTATVSSNSNSAQGPTGTVQFLNGSSNLGAAATCTPAGATTNSSGTLVGGASCTATLTTTLSSLPPGFIDYSPRGTPFVLLAWLVAVLAMFSFLMAVKLAARRKQYAYAGLAFFLMAAAALAGCSGTSSSSSGGGSSRTISAKYSGDSNYAGSTGSTAITVH